MFRFLILGLLRDGVPRHGYALAKAYSERSGVDISTGNFYRELQRLVTEGFVQMTSNPPGADARRTPYQITEVGRVTFNTWLFEPTDLGEGQREDDMSTRALFLTEADPGAVRALVERWQEQLWLRGKVQERARDSARAKGSGVLALLFSRRLKYTAADLEFLAGLRALYEQEVPVPKTEPQTSALAAVPPVRVAREPAPRPKPPRARR